jgi:prevent-host-death family protein
MEVGIRELRAELSRFIKRVREGEEIVVTDRGKAVARILPVEGQRNIDRLIAAGIVKPARRRTPRPVPRPIEDAGPISDLVVQSRR